jgi:hypothetical protein
MPPSWIYARAEGYQAVERDFTKMRRFQPSFSSELIRELKFSTCLSEKIAASTIKARLLDRDGI